MRNLELNNAILNQNQINDISTLSDLTSLTYLALDDNQISDVSALSDFTSLISLGLDDNQISDVSALSGLTNLTYLLLRNNQVSDISALTSLDNLVFLYLDGNYLNTSAYCVDMDIVSGNNPGIDLRYDPNPNPLMADCSTDMVDFGEFAAQWVEIGCGESNNWCGGADMDHINDVWTEDLTEFASYWLAGI